MQIKNYLQTQEVILIIYNFCFSDYLDEIGFAFVRQCIEAIESRGLDDEGLYRLVGVSSKVNKLTQMALGTNFFDFLKYF